MKRCPGDDTARYDDRGGDNSVAHIHERLESRINNLELYIRSSKRNKSGAPASFRQSPYLPQGHCPPQVTESNNNQTPDQAKYSLSGPESVTAGTQAEMKTVLILMMMSWSLTTHQPFWVISVIKVR